jgi:prophage regulatory protein
MLCRCLTLHKHCFAQIARRRFIQQSTTALGGLKMKRTILRIPAVKFESGLSRSTIYQRIAEGLWTKPVSLGARAVGWPSNEVAAINSARIAGKTDKEIRALVAKLEAARKDAK